MAYSIQFPKLLQIEMGRWLLLIGFVAATHLFCQSLLLPYRNALLSLLPDDELQMHGNNSLSSRHSSPTHLMNLDSLVNSLDLIDASLFTSLDRRVVSFDLDREIGHKSEPVQKDESKESNFTTDNKGLDDDSDFVEDANIDNDLPFEEASNMDESSSVNENKNQDHELISEKASETRQGISLQRVVKPSIGLTAGYAIDANASSIQHESSHQHTASLLPQVVSTPEMSSTNTTILKNMASNASDSHTSGLSKTSVEEKSKKLPEDENQLALQSRISTSGNGTVMTSNPVRKKMRCEMPPKSIMLISEMNRLLLRRRLRSRAMRPKWSSARDQEILAAKLQIVNGPIVKNDPELYAPLFRNISMFKRSYELMERILKVYTYKDGEKPIFHQPILKGLYASEGWFMKLMEGNKRFAVKDPRKAHLFYMPFSSRMLEHSLYVRNSHNRTNLRQYLKDYAEKIAAKYPYWNRTGGADHFVVACHDWAPYETRHHMEQCIKALCNADVTQGFKIGRDVSLPETYVRSARNPLRDLGGKPPSKRHILAFYAGNMHGYLRKILLKHWLNREPDMKIFGPMPPGVASKMNYIEHMKSSKFCICPKGYEVNSPRVVEAIFYECVPVIISDNFVPPFFEVLNWDAFSVILAEKDIPNLKDVLLAISEEEYLGLQQGVRKVQRHFLWHAKPLKYDLFHMALHSIWYNRVFQVKLR